MNKREVTYYDVSPYAALSAVPAAPANVQEFGNVKKLFRENMKYRSIQTCEHNYTILDGTHSALTNTDDIALWSKKQSLNPSRLLPDKITLDVTFGGLQSSAGLAFYFDTANNVYCDTLNIKWYKDNTLLSDMTFYPDNVRYSCVNNVEFYNKVKIEFTRLNMPGRYLKIESIFFGIVRVFGEDSLESLEVNEGVDPSGKTVCINSASFTINAKDSVPYMFLKRQPLHITYGGTRVGTYYIDKSKKYTGSRFTVEAIDKIGVLDLTDEFAGDMYANIYAGTVIESIVGGLFEVEIDENLRNTPINGWLPAMKKREALAQVALAIGAVVDATRTDTIKIRAIPRIDNIMRSIGRSEVYNSSTVDIEFPCTGVEVVEHNFKAGTAVKDLFKDTFTGEKLVKFTEPTSNLTITNGAIIGGGVNFARIMGNGTLETVLQGKPYIDNQSSVIVKTPLVIEGTQERVEKIDKGYLIDKNISKAVAQRLYEYYTRRNAFDGEYLIAGNDSKIADRIGDTVRIATIFGEDVTGQIEKLTLFLGSANIKARGVIRGN